jgi:hypothetical protein
MAIAKRGPALAVILVIAGLTGAGATVAPALADGTGSRILDSPSRDVIHRNEPALRSIVPGGNRTTTRSLSGMVGDLRATGGREAAGGLGPARQSGSLDCVLHHERLDRTARQPFAASCDPTVDRGAGYPAFTTR